MRIGYACINTTIKQRFRTCRLKTVEDKGISVIKEITLHNLDLTRQILLWNASKDIYFYRMTSDMIPFASHEINTWKWWEDKHVIEATNKIREIKEMFNMRISMHPGQYSVLNSPNEKVVSNAIKDLDYHATLMDMIDGDDLIIHGGGKYGDPFTAMNRFIKQYNLLDNKIKKYIRLENDDRTYSLQDVLFISQNCGVPICLDIHHHNCLNNNDKINYEEIYNTWDSVGIPKVHISTGKEGLTDRRHHDNISEDDFYELLYILGNYDVDIMFESKAKEISVLPYIGI